jgi:putative ABC transport system substrate-binding protein
MIGRSSIVVNRRTFVCGLTLATVIAPRAGSAQQAGKAPHIGWLGVTSRGTAEHNVQAFERALGDRGWTTGKNVVIDYRWAEGKYDRLPGLAAELVRLEPQVIVVGPMAAARAAKDATSTIPIVMGTVTDPIGEGLIASLARPGGNVTGLTMTPTWEIYAKQLQLLKEAVPTARRIAFLWSPANVAAPPGVKTAEEAARSLGIELQVVGARAPEEFESAFRTMTDSRAQALLILADGMFFAHRARLAHLAVAHRLPTMLAAKEYVEAGGLISYGTSYPDLFRRAAIYVDRILRGAKPADLAVEQATKFEMVINLKTAKALGLTVPQSLLLRADQIIE